MVNIFSASVYSQECKYSEPFLMLMGEFYPKAGEYFVCGTRFSYGTEPWNGRLSGRRGEKNYNIRFSYHFPGIKKYIPTIYYKLKPKTDVG